MTGTSQSIIREKERDDLVLMANGTLKWTGLIREDGHADTSCVDVDSNQGRSVDDSVDRLRRGSAILQHLLEARPVTFAAEVGIRLVFVITKSVDIKISAVLANDRGGAPKAFAVTVVMIARAETR